MTMCNHKEDEYEKKRKVVSSLLVIVLLVTFLPIVAAPTTTAQAKKVYKAPGQACASGRYVFFVAKNNTQIQRYDTKTKKVKVILDSSVEGSFTNGFYGLTIKGKYIYFTWDKFCGSDSGENYVYRMNFNGKQRKKLACGGNAIIAGNRIVYLKGKRYYDSTLNAYVSTCTNKTYSMSLTGKNKKKCSAVSTKAVSVSCYPDTTGNLGGYIYTLNSNNTSITRKNVKTGKKTKIYSNKNGITEFSVAGKYIYITCYTKKNSIYASAYITKLNGKAKKKVASWMMAG